MPEEYYEEIMYSTGAEIKHNLFVNSPFESSSIDGTENNVMDMADKTVSLSMIKSIYTEALRAQDKTLASLAQYVDMLGDVVNVMPGTNDFENQGYSNYVLSQYDVIAINPNGNETGLPQAPNEAVLVVGQNNDLTDILLAQLGLINSEQFLEQFDFAKGEEEETTEKEDFLVDFSNIWDAKYTFFMDNDSLYTQIGATSFMYPGIKGNNDVQTEIDNQTATEITITGVLRLKQNLSFGCLSDGLNVTERLVNDYVAYEMANPSALAQYIKADGNCTLPVSTLAEFIVDSTSQLIDEESALQAIGASDDVAEIAFYTQSFNTKKDMLAYLDGWNDMCARGEEYSWVDENGQEHQFYWTDMDGNVHYNLTNSQEVKYMDTVGLLMGMVEMMLNAITIVLVAFTSISLIVSSVMIGIITYVSVVERTREIGVLRSLGARKKDIKNLFNAETFIIGLASGTFGVVITYLMSFGINAMLGKMTGISTLASLPFVSALIMITISILLTLISGLIPARAAAKKDPVVALRSE